MDKPSVIITGAGSGIGRGIARAFVDAGYEVFASDISQERLEETKAELSSPSSLHPRIVDVSSYESVGALVDEVVGPQRQTDLVRLLGSDAATMTRTVQRLENAGFVRRRRSPSDKRATIVEPTAASNALRQEVERAWLDLEASTVNDLTPKEQAEALEVLGRIEESLTRAAAQLD
jgi:DNA-binding MarR family transcriptional regulator